MPTSESSRPPTALAGWIREVAAAQDPRVAATTPVVPLLTGGLPTRPIAPEPAQVYICAGVIVKLHGRFTDRARLARRLHCISGPDIDRLWIQPLLLRPIDGPDGRLATVWPRVTVLASIDRPPWSDAGRLLARLHSMPVTDDPPRLGGHTRLARTISWLATEGPADLAWLIEVGQALADQLAQPAHTTLAHGDFHLGQLGHTPLRRSWKLLDVDDFGVGDPAWDLSRVAGFQAAGLLPDDAWDAFITAYREAAGPAIPADGDPWPRLRATAQASLVIAAAQQVRSGPDPAAATALLDACARLSRSRAER